MKRNVVLLSVSCLAFAALGSGCAKSASSAANSSGTAESSAPVASSATASVEIPTSENGTDVGTSVAGTYKSAVFDTKINTREYFQLVLAEDHTATVSLYGEDGTINSMMGPFAGTYWHENEVVHLLKLTNPNGMMSKAPDLWSDQIYCSGDFGYATAIIENSTTFHFKKLASDTTSSSSSTTESMPVEGAYTEWNDVAYSDNTALKLTGKMKNGPGAKPLLLTIPGGAFKFCDTSAHSALRDYFADQNYVAFTVTYSVGNASYPQNIIDVKQAIQYLVDNKDEYHIDVDNINILGSSAGGYLAAMASLTGANDFVATGKTAYTCKVNNLTTFFGATQWMVSPFSDNGSTVESAMLGYSKISDVPAATLTACNPTTYLSSAKVNKVWVSHGDADTTIAPAMSEAFYTKVKDALGEKVTHYEVLSGAKHEDAAFYAEANLKKVLDWNAILKEEIGGTQYAYTNSYTIQTPGGEMTMNDKYLLTLQDGGVCAFRNAEKATCYTGTYTLTGNDLVVTGLVDSTGAAPVGGNGQGAIAFIDNGGFSATIDTTAKTFVPNLPAAQTSSSAA